MFGAKKSGIPIPGSASKSSIPVVKKAGKTTTPLNGTKNNAKGSNVKSSIPSPSQGNGSQERPSGTPTKAPKVSELPNDPKLLKARIVDLQKQLDDREETLNALSEKLAVKSEECADMMDERDTMRKRNSIDLQQVTKDYMELQERLKEERGRIAAMEKNHREELEHLQLELDVSKGEHELEISMLRKEIIDVKNKSQHRGIPLDVETDRLKVNYENEIQALKEQLQEQSQKTQEAEEKLQQNEFELLELDESAKRHFQEKLDAIAAEHKVEIENLKRSKDFNSNIHSEESLSELLRKEHEAYVDILKEQHDKELEQMKSKIQELSQQIYLKETEAATELVSMRKEYETQIEGLKSQLQQSREDADKVTTSKDVVDVEELKLKHSEEIKELQELHSKEMERIHMENQRNTGEEEVKSSMENEMKRQLETYEHEMRACKAELKKERQEFTQAREVLENSLTEMEQEMKTREEKIRWELKEEHKYELENLIEEHESTLHEKQKAHKHELADLKKIYEARTTITDEDEQVKADMDLQNQIHEKEIEGLTIKYENEIENLQDTLESLQMEHKELQTEYDLMVNDLAHELETTKLKAKGNRNRRSSEALLEGIGKLKSGNEERVQHLTAELKQAQKIISSLNEEVAALNEREKTSVEHLDKVTKLEELVKELEKADQEERQNSEALQAELDDRNSIIERLENEKENIHGKIKELEKDLDCLRSAKETEIFASKEKMSELMEQAEKLHSENREIQQHLEREMQSYEVELGKTRTETQQELHLQKGSYEEKLASLQCSNQELQSYLQKIEDENQQLRDEVKGLQNNIPSVEPRIIANESFSICSENIDMIGDEPPEPTEELMHDQRMKGIVEDFENKIKDLQAQLTKVNHEMTSKDSRLESVISELNILRKNLEDERNLVRSLEDRCQKLLESRDAEIDKMREKFERGTQDSVNEISARESQTRHECNAKIETLKSELTKALHDNNELTEKIKSLRTESEKIEQQLVEQEAKYIAEELKQSNENNLKVESLEEAIHALKDELRSVTTTMETDRTEHHRKMKETEFLVEQLKQSESNDARIRDLVDEVQKQQDENASLRSELTTERETIAKHMGEYQKESRTKSAEIDSLASMVDSERRAHKQKLEQLEMEMKKRDDEASALSSMLETEQTNHEKTIRDTQKHIGKLEELEIEKNELTRENLTLKTKLQELDAKNEAMEHETTLLKSKLRELKSEFARKSQESEELLSHSKKMTMDEMEEVQKLNRSLTQAEIRKEKLIGAVESSKQELQKTQSKYQKTKDKLKTVTQKWQKEHTKLEEILLSPRVDMGLQTSILQPEDLEDAQTRLSDSIRNNTILEEELKDSKQGLLAVKNDMQAMKRANNVLIKQNQVLYLETESLKQTVDELSRKTKQLRELSVELTDDNKNFERQNTTLKEKLEATELSLKQVEDEKSSFDALRKNSLLELEERRVKCQKFEEENERLRNHNEFLILQGKRLQTRADELDGEIKQLKNDLLTKEVDLLKKEKLMSEIQNKSSDSLILTPSSPVSNLQSLPTGSDVFQMNGTQGEQGEVMLESRPGDTSSEGLERRNSSDFVSQMKSLKESVGNGGEGNKGYVGVKSYQVIEWDTKQKSNPQEDPPKPLPSNSDPLSGIQLAKIKQLEFESNDYLGSAYWETLNFLKTMKSSN